MSTIVVGWQLGTDVDDERVLGNIDRIKARYQPLFQETIEHTGVWRQNQGLIHFDVRQPDNPRLWAGNETLACVTGSPTITAAESPLSGASLDARVLHGHLVGSSGLADRRALHQINPPFTFCSFDANAHLLQVVHDGLGMDQFFIASTANGTVFSNKCWPILLFLNEPARIDHDAWRLWFCLGWIPGHATPFQNIRYLARGELIRADSRTVAVETEDTLRSWMSPSDCDAATLMGRAGESVRQIIRLHQPTASRYSADLTGGRDSRALCSVLIKEGIPCSFHTGGPRHSPDVMLARRLARRFNLEWHHVDEPGLSGRRHSAALLDVLFTKLLIWGEGLVEANRFTHFEPEPCPTEHGAYLSGGQGEISKSHYAASYARNPRQAPDFQVAPLPVEPRIRQLLNHGDAVNAISRLRQHMALGETYGIAGWPLVDFFHVTEKVRRWQAAHLAVNLFDGTVLPFVNVEHIRLAFALTPLDKAERTFQTFIIRQNAPALLKIPFADAYHVRLWARLAARRKRYRWTDYMREDGRALVESLFSSHPVLWEILDKNKTRAIWNDFVRGSDDDTFLILGLVSFRHWYDMYVEPISGSSGQPRMLA